MFNSDTVDIYWKLCWLWLLCSTVFNAYLTPWCYSRDLRILNCTISATICKIHLNLFCFSQLINNGIPNTLVSSTKYTLSFLHNMTNCILGSLLNRLLLLIQNPQQQCKPSKILWIHTFEFAEFMSVWTFFIVLIV